MNAQPLKSGWENSSPCASNTASSFARGVSARSMAAAIRAVIRAWRASR